MKKKNPTPPGQPEISPDKSQESLINAPNENEQRRNWANKIHDGDKSRKLRGNDAKRLKGGEKGD